MSLDVPGDILYTKYFFMRFLPLWDTHTHTAFPYRGCSSTSRTPYLHFFLQRSAPNTAPTRTNLVLMIVWH